MPFILISTEQYTIYISSTEAKLIIEILRVEPENEPVECLLKVLLYVCLLRVFGDSIDK